MSNLDLFIILGPYVALFRYIFLRWVYYLYLIISQRACPIFYEIWTHFSFMSINTIVLPFIIYAVVILFYSVNYGDSRLFYSCTPTVYAVEPASSVVLRGNEDGTFILPYWEEIIGETSATEIPMIDLTVPSEVTPLSSNVVLPDLSTWDFDNFDHDLTHAHSLLKHISPERIACTGDMMDSNIIYRNLQLHCRRRGVTVSEDVIRRLDSIQIPFWSEAQLDSAVRNLEELRELAMDLESWGCDVRLLKSPELPVLDLSLVDFKFVRDTVIQPYDPLRLTREV